MAAIDKVRGQEAEEVERVCVSSNGCPVEQRRIRSDIRGIGWSRVFPRERVEWIRVRSDGDRNRIGQGITRRGYKRIWMELSNKL